MPGVGPTESLLVAFLDSPFLGPGLAFAGALLAAAFVIALVRRWRRETTTHLSEASDQLSHYQALYERGALSEEEYQGLRRALRGELGAAKQPAPPGAPPPEGIQAPAPPPAEGGAPPTDTGIRPS